MNHMRNAIRLAIIVSWMIAIGLVFTAISNANNAHAIGWATWIFYGVVTIVTIYFGIFATKYFWSYK
jgi:hypothetical protein